ncbi:MAG: hypothetical protein SGJ13_00625 [Actinomycetota bacterium]|nr:hypothetical protein [Actinomycetota bacterium]
MQLGFPGLRPRSGSDAPRRNRLRPLIMGAMVAGLAVAALGSGFVATKLDEPGAAKRAADPFVELVLAHEYESATASMCTEVVAGEAPSDWTGFDEYFREREGEETLAHIWRNTKRHSDGDRFTRVRYTVRGPDSEFTLEIRMLEEGGSWKPCGIDVVDLSAVE